MDEVHLSASQYAMGSIYCVDLSAGKLEFDQSVRVFVRTKQC